MPDWADRRKTVLGSALQDMGELAARMGSIVTFDRRGDVVWLDDFEHGIVAWSTAVLGAGAAVDVTAATSLRGGVSCQLTAGSGGGQYAEISRYISSSIGGRVGAKTSFAANADVDRFRLHYVYYSGAILYQAGIEVDVDQQLLRYLDNTLTWTTFQTGVTIPTTSIVWNDLKLVSDLDTGKYAHAILGANGFDMSSLDLYRIASAIPPSFLFRLANYGLAGVNGIVYVDDFILTVNEP